MVVGRKKEKREEKESHVSHVSHASHVSHEEENQIKDVVKKINVKLVAEEEENKF